MMTQTSQSCNYASRYEIMTRVSHRVEHVVQARPDVCDGSCSDFCCGMQVQVKCAMGVSRPG